MIVISHPWEFVPKGSSSQLISHNSISTSASQAIGSKTDAVQATTPSAQGTKSESIEPKMSHPQFYLHKSHLNRFYSNQNLSNPGRESLPEDNNSSISEISFAYLHKSPIVSNFNFDFSINEKWHLKQVNEFCEAEIYIKDNRVILSYGVDNESKCIRRTFTFESPVIDSNWFNFKTDTGKLSFYFFIFIQ